MKKIFILFSLLGSITLLSCSPTVITFYQVYKVNSAELKKDRNFLVFENSHCKIEYNLFENQGDVGFLFYNKTDSNIYIDKGETFFIKNGMAYDYFLNRTLSSTSEEGLKYGSTFSDYGIWESAVRKGNTITFSENKIICVPPNTAKKIGGYNVTTSLYRSCELYRYPKGKENNTMKFSKENSPFVFSNRIKYCFDKDCKNYQLVTNEFWVYEINNLTEYEALKFDNRTDCDEKASRTYYFRNVQPDWFYVKYTKSSDDIYYLKH